MEEHIHTHHHHLVSVDSRDRNKLDYPNPATYSVTVPRLIAVTKIELVSVEVPQTQYAITKKNNVIVLKEPAPTGLVIEIPPGTYTGNAIASLLTLLLPDYHTCTFDPSTRKLTFDISPDVVPPHPFDDALQVATTTNSDAYSNLCWGELGFTDQSQDIPYGHNVGPITAPHEIDMDCDSYIIMSVTFPKIMSGQLQTTGLHSDCFAKLLYPRVGIGYGIQSPAFCTTPISFDTINRVDRLGFSFFRPDGDLVDFNAREHSFTLRFTCANK